MSRIFTIVAALAATTLLSSAAFAGCNSGTYCGGSSTLAPLGSWSGTASTAPSYSSGTTYSSGTNSSATSYGSSYGTGSTSSPYTGSGVEMFGFSGSTASISGLGANESLQATNCPVDVYNPTGARVLGCYNVVKQVPQTNYVRVVRPVVYVRYPVPTPVAVPYYVNQAQSPCAAQNVVFSRYVNRPSCGNGW